MKDPIECIIKEQGNGMPDVGDYIAGSGGSLYRIVSMGRLEAGAYPGTPYWCHGTVERVEWDACTEDEQHTAFAELGGEP